MAKNFLSPKVKQFIEGHFKVKILFYDEYKDRNGYTEEDVLDCAYICGDEIYLGKYNDPRIELLCLFHELGHVEADKQKICGNYILKTSQEAMPWEFAVDLIKIYSYLFPDVKFDLKFNSDTIEYKFIQECLATYVKNEF